jgi:hypothetical protein
MSLQAFRLGGRAVKLSDQEIEKLRASGVKLDADGRFWHQGVEVTHHGLRAAFWRWLDRNPDGRWVLRLDANRFVYLDVEDAPFVVRSLRWEDGQARLRLSDDSEQWLDPSTLRLDPKGVAYCAAKGRFTARFSTAAWNALSEKIVERDGGAYLETADGAMQLR